MPTPNPPPEPSSPASPEESAPSPSGSPSSTYAISPAIAPSVVPARNHFVWRFGYRFSQIFLGLMFFTGGMGKLMPFPGLMGPVWLEERLEPYGLALFARFIAWSEAIIGLLVLSGRFTTLGAIMMVPLLGNIFFVVTSMGWRGTPYVVGGFLVLNAYLLWHDRARIKLLFIDDPARLLATRVRRVDPPGDGLSLAGISLCLLGPILFALQPHTGVVVVVIGLLLMLSVVRRRGRIPASTA